MRADQAAERNVPVAATARQRSRSACSIGQAAAPSQLRTNTKATQKPTRQEVHEAQVAPCTLLQCGEDLTQRCAFLPECATLSYTT